MLKNGVPWDVAVGEEIPKPLNELWTYAMFIIFREIDGDKFNWHMMSWENQE